jgi:hypothetical protein
MEQVPLAATLVPHVLVSEKSPGFVPVIDTPPMRSATVSLLVNVIVCGELDLPNATVPKFRLAGESDT